MQMDQAVQSNSAGAVSGEDRTQDRAARVRNWLEAGKLRPTRQRLVLADLLVGDGRDRHVTAESLHHAAMNLTDPTVSDRGNQGAKVSLATVYNTLRAFCRAGLMHEITVDSTRSYFDTRTDDHPHFYWEETAELTDAPKGDLSITHLPDPPEGAVISRVDVVIRLREI